MLDRAAFLQAVRASPDVPVLRLAFADWLEERDAGDPLAAFIRLQFELESWRHDYDDPAADKLRQREERTLRRYRRRWLGAAHRLTQGGERPIRLFFRRGLVEMAWASARVFLAEGETLWNACPALHELVLHQPRRYFTRLAESPLLAPVKRLTVADWLTRGEARLLARSPHLRGLEALTLWLGNKDDREVCRAFAATAELPALRRVKLVQLHGGLQAGADGPALRARADEIAAEFNRLRGESITEVYRPFDQLFPMRGDMHYGMIAGHLPGGQPALALPGDRHLVLLRFDPAGSLVEVTCKRPCCDADELPGRLRKEFGFKPGLIRVREFTTHPEIPRRRAPWFFTSSQRPADEDIAVVLWPYFLAAVAGAPDTPHHPYPWPQPLVGEPKLRDYTLKTWRECTLDLHAWMEDGDYVIDCWNDYWGGRDGQIHAS